MNPLILRTLLAACIAGFPMAAARADAVTLTNSHDFFAPANIQASASSQLAGLCSLADFRAITPAATRFVYDFDAWPTPGSDLGSNTYTFNFDLNGDGTPDQAVTVNYTGNYSNVTDLAQVGGNATSSLGYSLGGLGDIGWNGSTYAQHTLTFQSPVSAVGLVYYCAAPFYLKRSGAYPVSYTLSDGTVVNLGASGASGATISGSTYTFLGVIDSTGKGIISLTTRLLGTGSTSQNAYIADLAFVLPSFHSSTINLSGDNDFVNTGNIQASAATQLSGLCSLAAFETTGTTHRYVYSFENWPATSADLGSNSYTFPFDLNGDGTIDQQVTATYTGPYSGTTDLTQTNLGAVASSPVNALGGLGDIGLSGSGYAAHTFAFSRPVSSVGFVYRSAGAFYLGSAGSYPVSYTLTNGTVVNIGAAGAQGAAIAANTNTFVGVTDTSGLGIISFTTRVQGGVTGSQSVTIDDLAFVVLDNPGEGPPPGPWTLTFDDEFTGGTSGTSLNTALWSTGYRWGDVINDELEGYVPQNVSVANGLCTILVDKQTVQNTDMYGDKAGTQSYASGNITTYGKWTQTYGYFEARVKMTSGPGTWPAFWMLPDRGASVTNLNRRVEVDAYNSQLNGYAIGNEIDCFEYLGNWKNQTTGISMSHSGYFWGYSGEVNAGSASNYAQANGSRAYPLESPDTQFHNYGVYWRYGQLIYYIDGNAVLSESSPTYIGYAPEYLILNAALSTNGWTEILTTAQIDAGLPSTMQIEYVRAYSAPDYGALTWTGSGAWNNSSSNWYNNGGALPWNPAEAAVFSGSSSSVRSVDIATPVTANGVTFTAGNFAIGSAGGFPLALSGTTNGGNYLAVTNMTAAPPVINAVISGTAGIDKVAGGALVITASNTFAGPVTISGGTLSVGSDAAFGSGSNGIILHAGGDGGTLAASSTFAAGSQRLLSGTGAIDVSSENTLTFTGPVNVSTLAIADSGTVIFAGTSTKLGTVSLSATSTLIVNGPIINPVQSTLVKSGSGRLLLGSGSNVYSDLQVLGGTVEVESNANLGTGGLPSLQDDVLITATNQSALLQIDNSAALDGTAALLVTSTNGHSATLNLNFSSTLYVRVAALTINGVSYPASTYNASNLPAFLAGAGNLLVSTTPLLDNWRYLYFGTYNNSGSAADTADPNGNGTPNLIEYALGSNPIATGYSPPIRLGKSTDGTRLTLTFNSVADPILTYTVEAAPSLSGTWTAIWSSTGAANIAGAVTVQDTATISSSPTRFLRLRVSR